MVTAFTGTDGASGGMRSIFDSGAYTTKQNVSEFIDAIDPRDIPLLSMLGMGAEAGSAVAGADSLSFPCLNTTHTWQSDELIPSQVLLTGSDGSGGETLTVGTTSVNYFKIGDLINVGNVARTYGVVTAINTSGGTLTIAAVQAEDLSIVQKEYIGIGALKGNGNDRSFFTTPVPVDGDRQIAAITGEYTMEVRNADKAHGWIHSLSTTLS